ncbi:uncharacterized protein LOC131935471 [Physella acuta]|uniref:uncharacterized protein LOC131935471 n=1 Tax=Physella acuta TaxID=109671 RepID=UPI0027DB414F|nr:uncharacterized protein LOC131935471 [Physella acuta]
MGGVLSIAEDTSVQESLWRIRCVHTTRRALLLDKIHRRRRPIRTGRVIFAVRHKTPIQFINRYLKQKKQDKAADQKRTLYVKCVEVNHTKIVDDFFSCSDYKSNCISVSNEKQLCNSTFILKEKENDKYTNKIFENCEGKKLTLFEELFSRSNFFKIKSQTILDVYYQPGFVPPKVIEGILWECLNVEQFRLVTFCKYPITGAQSSLVLAANGFVYIGTGADDSVLCYFCCRGKKNWLRNENVSNTHTALSPNCSMVTGIDCKNVPIVSRVKGDYSFDQLVKILQNKNSSANANCDVHTDSCKDLQPQFDSQNEVKPPSHSDRSRVNKSNDIETDSLPELVDPVSQQQQSTPRRSHHTQQSATVQQGLKQGLIHDSASRSTLVSNAAPAANRMSAASDISNVTSSQTTSFLRGDQTPQLHVTSSQVPHSQVSEVSVLSTQNLPATACNSQNLSTTTSNSQNLPATAPNAQNLPTTTTNSQTPASNPENQTNINTAPPEQVTVNSEKGKGRGPTYAELGIITERAKRPEYAIKSERTKTFEPWPRNHHLAVPDLVEAGFYYAGYGDCARCFYCGGGLRNWEDEDDVFVEHARWFPKCAYIRQLMGHAFVHTVQDLNKSYDKIPFSLVREKIGNVDINSQLVGIKMESLSRDPAVRAVVEIGYKEDVVLKAANTIKMQDKENTLSADLILDQLIKMNCHQPPNKVLGATQANVQEDKEQIKKIKESNSELRRQTACKICFDKEVAVVFLPCGHFAACSDCAVALNNCPICRKQVKGVVRAFIG